MDYLRTDVIRLPLANLLATWCDADVLYVDNASKALVIASTQIYW